MYIYIYIYFYGDARSLDYGSYEPLSKLLVSPLITPIVVPYIIPYMNPFKEFRLWLIYRVTPFLVGPSPSHP